MAKTDKRGLGRGLGALFGEDLAAKNGTEIKAEQKASENEGQDVSRETSLLRISLIEPNRDQPRKIFDEESLRELSDSIREHGVLQPILVQKKERGYEILVGERRWRAARMAGLKEIPVIIKEVGKQEASEIALIENIQRENLGSMEEARAYRALIDDYGLTQEQLAERVGKNRTTITNSMRLLQLDEEVQKLVEGGELSAGHARAILALGGKRAQYKAARDVIENGLSVRETEKMIKRLNRPVRKKEQKEPDIYLEAQAEELTRALNTRVHIHPVGRNKGRIEIEYYSAEELESLIEKLGGERNV